MEDFRSALESAGKALPLLVAICLSLSVLYDWGFLSALNLRFSQVPTTISDHLRSTLLWAPFILVFLAFMILIFLFLNKYESERNLPEDQRFRTALKFGLIATILFATSWILFGDRAPFLLHSVILMGWFTAVIWLVPWVRYPSHEQRGRLILALIGIPGAMFSIYMFGESAGVAAIRQESRPIRVVMKDERDHPVVRASLLRSYEQYLLLKDERGEIRIVKWQDIARLEGFRPPAGFKGILCSWFDIACE